MKEALKVDLTGALVDVELVADQAPEITDVYEPNPENPDELVVLGHLITKRVPAGTYKPVWDFSIGDWKEGLTQEELDVINPPVTLDTIKQRKIAGLHVARDAELIAGFTSDAIGTTLYFGFDPIDQAYLSEKALLMTIDQTASTIDWKTRDGWVTLTRDQFFHVIKDGGKHKEGLVRKVMQLEALVLNCKTENEVNAILW